jgi:competence protein ComEC
VTSWRLDLARLRIDLANRIVAALPGPEGGIAAAFLVGDRRYISQHTYRLFQKSGLAHLLAISGLHMGLVCFGVMGVVRFCGALFPAYAVRVPLHKAAALVALIAGGLYVLLSGGTISAVRAFLMALLVVIAV